MQFVKTELDDTKKAYNHIKNEYDYTIKSEDLNAEKKELFKLIKNGKKTIKVSNDTISTLSLLGAYTEHNIVKDEEVYYSNMGLLIISDKYIEDLVTQISGSAMEDQKKIDMILHLHNEQIAYIDCGMDDFEVEMVNTMKIGNFNFKLMNKKPIISKKLINDFSKTPMYVVIDMSAIDYKQENSSKLNFKKITFLIDILKNLNIVCLDLINYCLTTEKESIKLGQIGKILMKDLMKVRETKINIYNEHSRFLIFRPTNRAMEEDTGWYILRGIDSETNERLLKSINHDSIIEEEVDTNGVRMDILISTTTMEEQNNKSYFMDHAITDCVLFPDEKTDMLFELVNK